MEQALENEFHIIVDAMNGSLKDLSDKHGKYMFSRNPFEGLMIKD